MQISLQTIKAKLIYLFHIILPFLFYPNSDIHLYSSILNQIILSLASELSQISQKQSASKMQDKNWEDCEQKLIQIQVKELQSKQTKQILCENQKNSPPWLRIQIYYLPIVQEGNVQKKIQFNLLILQMVPDKTSQDKTPVVIFNKQSLIGTRDILNLDSFIEKVNVGMGNISKQKQSGKRNKIIQKSKGYRMKGWNIRKSIEINSSTQNKKLFIRGRCNSQKCQKHQISKIQSEKMRKKNTSQASVSSKSQPNSLKKTEQQIEKKQLAVSEEKDDYHSSVQLFEEKKYIQSLSKINKALQTSANANLDEILQKFRVLFALNLNFEAISHLKFFYKKFPPQDMRQFNKTLEIIFGRIVKLFSYNWLKDCQKQEKVYDILKMFSKIVGIRDINQDIEDYKQKIKQIKFYIQDQLQELQGQKTADESQLAEKKGLRGQKEHERYFCSHLYQTMKNMIKLCRDINMISTFKEKFYREEVKKLQGKSLGKSLFASSLSLVLSACTQELQLSVFAYRVSEIFFYKETERSLHQFLKTIVRKLLEENNQIKQHLKNLEKNHSAIQKAQKFGRQVCVRVMKCFSSQTYFTQLTKSEANIQSMLPEKLSSISMNQLWWSLR